VTLLFEPVHQNEQIFFRVMTRRVLDKTLIHRLVLFKALWSCTETHLDLEPFGSHWSPLYGENSRMFSSKTWISFRQKKLRQGHCGWHGGE